RIHTRSSGSLPKILVAAVTVGNLRKPLDRVGRRAERFPRLTDCTLRTIGSHRRCHSGAVTTIFLINILQHLLSTFMFKVDVDIWSLVALAANEPLEQEIRARRIDAGHSETVADDGIGR